MRCTVRQVGARWEKDPAGCQEIVTLGARSLHTHATERMRTENRVVHYEACRFKPAAAANNAAEALSDVGSQLQRLSINGK